MSQTQKVRDELDKTNLSARLVYYLGGVRIPAYPDEAQIRKIEELTVPPVSTFLHERRLDVVRWLGSYSRQFELEHGDVIVLPVVTDMRAARKAVAAYRYLKE